MRIAVGTVAALAFALASGIVFAQGTEEQREACQPDAKRFCEQVGFDTAKIAQCMGKNYRKLTPRCRQVMRFGSVQRFCASELSAACGRAADSSGPAVACLRRAGVPLSPNCANALKAYAKQ